MYENVGGGLASTGAAVLTGTAVNATTATSLPFTGGAVLVPALIGLALLLVGVLMVIATRPRIAEPSS
jgi:multidrug transporter EmrE-like cation transporter